MKKTFIILLILGTLLVVSITPAIAGDQLQRTPNTAPYQPQYQKTGWKLYVGGAISHGSVLGDFAPYDWDGYTLDVMEPGDLWIMIEDCCLMGDTMGAYIKAVGTGQGKTSSATSPSDIWVNIYIPYPMAVRIWTGYTTPHTGAFPAGYTFYAWLNP